MEHVLVFVSIIVGVAVTDEILSLHRLLRARRRVRWDALPLLVAALVMLLLVRIWWSAAAPGQVGPVTIGSFIPDLIELILLVLLATAVLPDEVPSDGIDLRRFYDEEGGYVWTLFTLAFGWTTAVQAAARLAAGVPFLRVLDAMGAEFLFLGLAASLIVVRRRWWHALVLAGLSLGPLHWLSRSLT